MPYDPLDDDEEPFGEPLPPDDRLWRHPSEVGGFMRAATRPRQVSTLKILALTLAGGLIGSLVTVAALGAGGAFDRPVVEMSVSDPPVTVGSLEPPTTSASPPGAIRWTDAVRRIQPALARVEVSGHAGTVNGSAVAVRADGTGTWFITSADLLRSSEAVTLVLSGEQYKRADVVGVDQYTNIGVVKVAEERVPLPAFGTTAVLQPGSDALVAGAPARSAKSASAARALVSSLNFQFTTPAGVALQGMLQTDANITPGAKGGALIDATGAVLGIIAAMQADETGVERFGYAMPIEVARATADNLIDTGYPTRVWLGIQGSTLPGDQAEALGLSGGAVVNAVVPQGPAQQCGLAANDVIVLLNTTEIDGMTTLVMTLRNQKPNDTVTLTYVRAGEMAPCMVTLVEPPRPAADPSDVVAEPSS